MRRLLLVLALALPVLTSHGCSNGPTMPDRACRRWPLRYTSGGRTFNCEPKFVSPSCSAFPTNLNITWSYRSQSDFVHEADVPNRVLALQKETVGCGTFVGTGCNSNDVKYEYDSQGRLVRRVRTWSHSLGGGGTIDVVTYSAWDRRSRPTEGQVESGGQTTPLTIVYDDVRRIAEASNGEVVEQDAYGNVIYEAQIVAGSISEVHYTIESYQEVCEAGP